METNNQWRKVIIVAVAFPLVVEEAEEAALVAPETEMRTG
jgi:hypothetical protein